MIKGKNTKPEIIVRKYLFSKGLRYRLNVKALPGSPDIVLPKYKTAIFVNGCFWHGHQGCKNFVWPSSNSEFWRGKILSNRERDIRKISYLEDMGWKVIVIWECMLKTNILDTTLTELYNQIVDE